MGENTDFLEYSFDMRIFENLEQNFQANLQELIGDRSVESFKEQYERLHNALKRSTDSNKRLVFKCRELNEEIATNTVKVEKSIELLQQDRRTIVSLRQEIDKAWKMVETAQGREKKATETIESLKAEIGHLTTLIEQGGLLGYGHDNTVKDLIAEKEKLISDRDTQISQISKLKSDLEVLTTENSTLEKERSQLEHNIKSIETSLKDKKQQIEHESVHRDRLLKQLQNLQTSFQRFSAQIETQKKELSELMIEDSKLEEEMAETTGSIEFYKEENRAAQILEEEIEEQIKKEQNKNKELQSDVRLMEEQLADKEKDNRIIKNDIERKQREMHSLNNTIVQNRQALTQDEFEITNLRAEIASMNKELAELKKSHDKNENEGSQLKKKLDTIEKDKILTKQHIETQKNLTNEESRKKSELGKKLTGYISESDKMNKIVEELEKKRENCAREAAEAQKKYTQSKEEAKMSEIQLNHTQRSIAAADEELKKAQEEFEKIRVEKHRLLNQLTEDDQILVNLRKDVEKNSIKREEMEKEIKEKESALSSEKFELKRSEGIKEKLMTEFLRLKHDWSVAEATMNKHQEELNVLEQRIYETENNRKQFLAQQIVLMKQRDEYASQLIRKNDESTLLLEKIRIIKETLKSGEIEYQKKCEQANELRRVIKDMQRKNLILQRQCDQSQKIESELKTLQDDLDNEKMRVQALSEELENPKNPYRWRHLYDDDPSAAELLKEVKKLQKRLIDKTEKLENMEKEIAILKREQHSLEEAQKEKPSKEELLQLKKLQNVVKQKDKKLRTAIAELNTQTSKIVEFQDQSSQLTKSLFEAKEKQFSVKRLLPKI